MKNYKKPAIMKMAITEIYLLQGSNGGPEAGDANNPSGPNGGGSGANDVGDPDGSRNPSFSVWD